MPAESSRLIKSSGRAGNVPTPKTNAHPNKMNESLLLFFSPCEVHEQDEVIFRSQTMFSIYTIRPPWMIRRLEECTKASPLHDAWATKLDFLEQEPEHHHHFL